MGERIKSGPNETALTEKDLGRYIEDIQGDPFFSAHPDEIFPVVNEAEQIAVSLKTGLDFTLFKFHLLTAAVDRLWDATTKGAQVDLGVFQDLVSRRTAASSLLDVAYNVTIHPANRISLGETFTRDPQARQAAQAKVKK